MCVVQLLKAQLILFKEFLKKEFSHENIYFWAACERYKDTKDAAMRRRLACQIYQRHLSSTAAEPVNVDSHASGQITQELLDEAPADLFLQVRTATTRRRVYAYYFHNFD